MHVVVIVQRQSQLLQVFFALRSASRLSSLLYGRHQQRHENCDDRNDHE